MGVWNVQKFNDCEYYANGERKCNDDFVEVEIEQRISHQNYVGVGTGDDIALLRMDRNVAYTNFIKPICLPFSQELRDMNLGVQTMMVAGWGKFEIDYIFCNLFLFLFKFM